jgi:hypothetical protein
MTAFRLFLTWRLWYAWILASAANGIVSAPLAEAVFYVFALGWAGWCFLKDAD